MDVVDVIRREIVAIFREFRARREVVHAHIGAPPAGCEVEISPSEGHHRVAALVLMFARNGGRATGAGKGGRRGGLLLYLNGKVYQGQEGWLVHICMYIYIDICTYIYI